MSAKAQEIFTSICDSLAEKHELPREQIEEVLKAYIERSRHYLMDEKMQSIPGIGTFKLRWHESYENYNPKLDEKVTIPAGYKIRFHAAQAFEDLIKMIVPGSMNDAELAELADPDEADDENDDVEVQESAVKSKKPAAKKKNAVAKAKPKAKEKTEEKVEEVPKDLPESEIETDIEKRYQEIADVPEDEEPDEIGLSDMPPPDSVEEVKAETSEKPPEEVLQKPEDEESTTKEDKQESKETQPSGESKSAADKPLIPKREDEGTKVIRSSTSTPSADSASGAEKEAPKPSTAAVKTSSSDRAKQAGSYKLPLLFVGIFFLVLAIVALSLLFFRGEEKALADHQSDLKPGEELLVIDEMQNNKENAVVEKETSETAPKEEPKSPEKDIVEIQGDVVLSQNSDKALPPVESLFNKNDRQTIVYFQWGDTLASLAREHYGSAEYWPYLYYENRSTITSPDRIVPVKDRIYLSYQTNAPLDVLYLHLYVYYKNNGRHQTAEKQLKMAEKYNPKVQELYPELFR